MIDTAAAELRKTPLHARHRALHARMVPFAGWEMPVEYTGITVEHMAVRTRAGVFDVSHMGEIEVAGKNALAAVQRIACSDPAALQVGQAQYAGLLTPEGTFLDDMVVYRIAPTHFMLVVNASNVAKDYAWIAAEVRAAGEAAAVDASSRYALIALQGPASPGVLQPLTGVDLAQIRSYWFAHGEVAGARAMISRTGYTGEDGFEIFVPPNTAERVWEAILESGRAVDLLPTGLGARDTLRLEASMRLYGNDIDESTTVLEAGLGWMIGWTNERFVGRARLLRQRDEGVSRKLVGFEMVDRGIARHGYPVVREDRPVGVVTSGTQTPYLKKAIGMAYVPAEATRPGTDITIDVRGRAVRARVVPMPFYKRGRDVVPG
ncbi:MAG: glycine cleavage system protein T [Acidobacteria bacterium RIFCSPLOWO2_02_FULL_67_21]|nr:MAG: glycine cleavage system protein T [Acidobacteria bacterium RIFCSPLOWO2_02_FULL_67_21]